MEGSSDSEVRGKEEVAYDSYYPCSFFQLVSKAFLKCFDLVPSSPTPTSTCSKTERGMKANEDSASNSTRSIRSGGPQRPPVKPGHGGATNYASS